MTGLLLHPVTAHPPQERCPRLRVIQKGTHRERSPAHRRRSRLAVLVPSGSAVSAANAVIVDGADEPLTVALLAVFILTMDTVWYKLLSWDVIHVLQVDKAKKKTTDLREQPW